MKALTAQTHGLMSHFPSNRTSVSRWGSAPGGGQAAAGLCRPQLQRRTCREQTPTPLGLVPLTQGEDTDAWEGRDLLASEEVIHSRTGRRQGKEGRREERGQEERQVKEQSLLSSHRPGPPWGKPCPPTCAHLPWPGSPHAIILQLVDFLRSPLGAPVFLTQELALLDLQVPGVGAQ